MPNLITFELQKPIKFAGKSGNEEECSFIELRAPTGKVSDVCCAIEGLVQSALMRMGSDMDPAEVEKAKAEAEKNPDAANTTDPDAMVAVLMGSGADMKKIVLYFRELFRSVAFMQGEKAITEPRLDDLQHTDLKRMIGAYLTAFILS